jgi:hypothetical protein
MQNAYIVGKYKIYLHSWKTGQKNSPMARFLPVNPYSLDVNLHVFVAVVQLTNGLPSAKKKTDLQNFKFFFYCRKMMKMLFFFLFNFFFFYLALVIFEQLICIDWTLFLLYTVTDQDIVFSGTWLCWATVRNGNSISGKKLHWKRLYQPSFLLFSSFGFPIIRFWAYLM